MEIFRLSTDDVDKHRVELELMLRQVYSESFPDTEIYDGLYSERIEALKAYMSEDRAIVYGAREGSHLVGFIWIFESDGFDGKTIHINYIVVQSGSRGYGIGRRLLDEVENHAERRGIRQIELLVTCSNERAVGVFKRQGFGVERFMMKKRIS